MCLTREISDVFRRLWRTTDLHVYILSLSLFLFLFLSLPLLLSFPSPTLCVIGLKVQLIFSKKGQIMKNDAVVPGL